MVIASSGNCEAGRIFHHLKNGIEDSRNTVLLTGYQALNTLGRKLEEKRPAVPIFGELMRLRAEVAKLDDLSGHADQPELPTGCIKGVTRRTFQLSVEVPRRSQVFDL